MNALRTLSGLAFWRAPARDCGCPDNPGGDPSLSAAVTALGAKLARADGRTDPAEFDSFVEAFPPGQRSERDIRRLYALAGETIHGYEAYARRIGKRYGDCPRLLEKLIDGLFHVAEADGAVTDDELAYLERVAELVGLSPLSFRRLRTDHLGAPADDPYRLLDVAPDVSDEAVRAAWRRALVQHHPDKAVGRGLPQDLVDQAKARTTAINAAFEAVMRERRAFANAA
ncbi:MAG TPA: DnaJ family molecular chaperone [Caulobacteraceae bacterium]|jgi:DnaJ like chaperone protein|nr:DnaJ family molecular chaperone [Caulobacteraceae bacterium]